MRTAAPRARGRLHLVGVETARTAVSPPGTKRSSRGHLGGAAAAAVSGGLLWWCDGRVDPWRRQRVLAGTTLGWAFLSVVGGLVAVRGRTPWWRSFGWQHVGWGVADLGIVAVLRLVQRRRMARSSDPHSPAVTGPEAQRLLLILKINTVADVAYCLLGLVLWRRSDREPAAGAGAAILIQGAFLALHDGYHAIRAAADH